MDVVLNSHIALLVLGYLYEEKLDNVSKYFCKFSPYLDEEYQIIKKGLRPIIINSNSLSTVVREHCYIKSKVNEIISTFPRHIKTAFDRQTLSGKINHLLKIVKKTICTTEVENPLKRNRSEALSPSEKSSCTNTTQIENLPGYCPEKKRKIADSYMFVGNDFSEESESVTDIETSDEEPNVNTAFADKILENKPFQNKLLQNINKAIKVNSNNRNKHENNLISNSNDSEDLNQLDEIIQDVISATEKEPSFDEVINNVITCINNKKEVQKTSENELNELCIDNTPNLHSIQSETCSQIPLGAEKSNANSDLNKTVSDNECNITTSNSEVDINYSASKILLMNSTDFISASHQTFSPFKNDQILFDLNGVQTFPVLMGADGAMYINSNIMQSDVRQLGNIRADNFNLFSKNVGNLQVLNTESIIEELQDTKSNLDQNEITRKKNTIGNKNVSSPNKSIENKNSAFVSSVECKESKDKTTPEHNISVPNISITKSLSTPRRKTSHVKVLNFSPLKSFRILNNKVTSDNKSDKNSSSQTITEKSNSNTTVNLNPNFVVADNESSNSTDLTGDRSNITVIQRNVSSSNDTPKRKTNLISCKRNLSRSNSEETVKTDAKEVLKETANPKQVSKQSSNKIKKGNNAKQSVTRKNISLLSTHKNVEKSKAIDAMEEWKQLREKSKNPNFDQFLREIHSKTPLADAHITKRRKLRRKIGSKLKKGSKSDSPLNSSKKSNEEVQKVTNAKISQDIEIEDKIESILIEKEDKPLKKAQEKKSKSIETKTNFLNFRIKTPIKLNSRDPKTIVIKRVSKNSKNKSNKAKEVYDTDKQPICIETSIDAADQPKIGITKINEDDFKLKSQEERNTTQDLVKENNNLIENSISQKFCEEREKRTANIAHILDTPFKLDGNNLVPTTPGFLFSNCLPINNTITPMTKLSFSSLCNTKDIDIKTPAFAITPGGHLNCSTDKETPRSAIITDYSSGGSYYRPDDAIDINKKLDRELNAKFDKRYLNETENKLSKILLNSNISTDQNKPLDTVVTEIIPCPVVLEKVKSFSEEILDVVPHYKFIEAGLPDITDESTSSSSSSSDESSSTSSNSSSPAQAPVIKEVSVKEKTEPLSLLSNIDSSEDEEWEIQSSSKNKIILEENSQLVSNDGEVRFPVRSWITPKKNENKIPELTNEQNCQLSLQDMGQIEVDISINQVHSVSDRELNKKSELSEKLERVKAKLNQSKLESSGKSTNKKIKSTKIISPPNIKPETLEKNSNKIKTSNIQSEVLAALNLSAKKRNTIEDNTTKNIESTEISKEKNRCSQVDDNATSELFTLRMEEESNDSLEVRNAALTLTKMKTKRIGEVTASELNVTETKKRPPRKNENREPDFKDKNKTQSFINKNKCELKKSNSVKLKKNLKVNEKKVLRKCNSKTIAEVPSKEIKYEGLMEIQSLLKEGDSLNKNLSAAQIEDLNIKEKLDEREKFNESKNNFSTNEIKDSNHFDLNVGKITSITDSESESEFECEDPYNECQAMLADENSKNNKTYIFDESNVKELVPCEQYDFTKCSMKIHINDQIRKIECTEEIGLFHIKPTIETSKSIKQNSNKKKIKSNKIKKEATNNCQPVVENKRINKKSQELSSTTPFTGKIKITHRNKFSNDLENSISKKISTDKNRNENSHAQDSITYEKHGATSTKTSSQEKLSKQNIRNEDINAVLSHLYGNGK